MKSRWIDHGKVKLMFNEHEIRNEIEITDQSRWVCIDNLMIEEKSYKKWSQERKLTLMAILNKCTTNYLLMTKRHNQFWKYHWENNRGIPGERISIKNPRQWKDRQARFIRRNAQDKTRYSLYVTKYEIEMNKLEKIEWRNQTQQCKTNGRWHRYWNLYTYMITSSEEEIHLNKSIKRRKGNI